MAIAVAIAVESISTKRVVNKIAANSFTPDIKCYYRRVDVKGKRSEREKEREKESNRKEGNGTKSLKVAIVFKHAHILDD